MKQFFTNKKLIVLLVSVILFVSLISLSIRNSGNIPFIQQASNDITAIIGRIYSKPANAIIDTFDSIDNLQDTYEENQRLKIEIDRIYERQAELSTLAEENNRLEEELELKQSLTDYKTISGVVISRNPDNWVDQLIIDRGSQDGVSKGMPVMSGNGLIGRISETSPTSSKVVLLTNIEQTSNQISSEIIMEDETVNGIISDHNEETDQLLMSQITSTTEIKVGELVTTSGLGGTIPRGLVIGEVEKVSMDSYGLGQQVYVKPSADFNNIRFVTIIHRLAESGEE
ncbi:MAG: rod shape-determining protein MreC [Alkalibacterium gilvum]|uniref:Cell shape-determining protein MreC n=1 Tax=Alkalibacterium gilvum TaxID=1130080 RepID=A0A1H6ULM3_9LACT|nr:MULTISPECIES: rod shape-determining protein MreC [Alkalibacterium]MDN6293220.1 rod shape-determining protein MreC [Alkalibacterium sp.]MDN6295266.1 rod shape-determining protein MreC [Alkalibacterium sp.]MDN6385355.1 rod shape-determining protein MreC [Alkalibacterium sp.]MDN6398116.1 rod shape-determining protein MreC [Alkalibacterium sp.]MDN6729845.1 rod shape-determining protein MreC [Alkalibacterium sp.]